MTDETTARDRAIEVVGAAWRASFDEPWDHQRNSISQLAVDALLARPEVLRALAGAPTADVAELLRQAGDTLRAIGKAALVVKPTLSKPYSDAPGTSPWERFMAAPARDAYNLGSRIRRLLAAAPEGVDAADDRPTDDVEAVSEAWRVAALADEQPESVEPYGRDELIEHLAVLWREERRRVALDEQDADGMDLEAQGEMADQLDAAQAAIERVRDMAARLPRRERDAILRALDGETTEERS